MCGREFLKERESILLYSLYMSVRTYDNYTNTYGMFIHSPIWIKVYKENYYVLLIERYMENIEHSILRVNESEDKQ